MSGRLRRVAVSTFVVFHVAALLWWNFGTVALRPAYQEPPEGDGWTRMHEVADAVDRQGYARAVFDGYVRGTALFQRWVLFGPNAPHETGRIEVRGITGFDAQGRPVVDPTPLHSSDAPDLTDTTQMIGNPPCGWTRGDAPKAVFLRGAFARFQAKEHASARGIDYVGVQLLCLRRPIHQPGQDPEDLPWTTEVLWAGPVDP